MKQIDGSGRAGTAADRAAQHHQRGALLAEDDPAGLGRRQHRPGHRPSVLADEDTVRDVIHRFNEVGLACNAGELRHLRRW
ncbi:hypothetical protein [Nonomuraea fuscirosea]|uniref:hypothetical protein n=1 Tax=Nonomuraea fuscirosea TaxID=1291556 RepID=UPI001FE385A3|nr:hypothetical protein [Nonomuraea fuscirosea]